MLSETKRYRKFTAPQKTEIVLASFVATRRTRRSVATTTSPTACCASGLSSSLAAGAERLQQARLPHPARGRGDLERSRRPVNPSGLGDNTRGGPRHPAPTATHPPQARHHDPLNTPSSRFALTSLDSSVGA